MPLSDLALEQLRAYTSTVTPPDDFHAFWDAILEEARMFPLDAIFEPAEQYSRNMSSRPTTPSLNVAGKPDPAMKPGPHQTLSGRNSNNTSSCAGSPFGTCHRPYATPCVHEHVCIKCRFLQMDHAQAGRLEDVTNNAEERLAEARQHKWLGEVSALEESLVHLRRRREEGARLRETVEDQDRC